jgi:hypothetical protein
VRAPAPLRVTAEIRALDAGVQVVRVFRLTRAIGEDGVAFARELPFEPGRPVRVELRLPDDPAPLAAAGRVTSEGVELGAVDSETRARLRAYVIERMSLP